MRSTQNLPAPHLQHAPNPRIRLPWVIAGVLLAHWGVLYALPEATVPLPMLDAASTRMLFTTRTLTLAPPDIAPEETLIRPINNPRPLRKAEAFQPSPLADTVRTAPDSIAPQEPPLASSGVPDIQLAAATNTASPEAPTPTRPPEVLPPHPYAIPGSVRLKYEVRGEKSGIPVFANGELLWVQDGKTYEARMDISILMFSRVQTSKGQVGANGLEPLRFGDKVRSEVAAHFDKSKGKVTFSANTPDVPLQPGAQDQLSIFMHVASMIGGDPRRFPAGTELSFQAIGPRSSETWAFTVGNLETLTLPGGTVKAIKLSRPPANEYSPRADVWLAPEMGYMPVRIRLTEANGDVADQQWSATQKP